MRVAMVQSNPTDALSVLQFFRIAYVLDKMGVEPVPRAIVSGRLSKNDGTAMSASDEGVYDGCIVIGRYTGDSGATDLRAFLNNAHPWRVGVYGWAQFTDYSTTFTTGMSDAGGASPLRGAYTKMTNSDGSKSLIITNFRRHIKTAGTTALKEAYLSFDDSGTTKYICWRATSGEGDNIYCSWADEDSTFGGAVWFPAFYLAQCGKSVPNPLLMILDIDNVDESKSDNCLDLLATELRKRGGMAVCGWNSETGFGNVAADSVKNALKNNTDVLPAIVHRHTYDLWQSTTKSIDEILTAYGAAKAECTAQLGFAPVDNVGGYHYVPGNAGGWLTNTSKNGTRALYEIGVRTLRNIGVPPNFHAGIMYAGVSSGFSPSSYDGKRWGIKTLQCSRTGWWQTTNNKIQGWTLLGIIDNGGYAGLVKRYGSFVGNILTEIARYSTAGIYGHGPNVSVDHTGWVSVVASVADGDTVTIGDKTYEFDTNGTVTDGNIRVDVSSGATATAAATALRTAIIATQGDVLAVDTVVNYMSGEYTVPLTAKDTTKSYAITSSSSSKFATEDVKKHNPMVDFMAGTLFAISDYCYPNIKIANSADYGRR